jgi:ASC-1-like (ASCH) protein
MAVEHELKCLPVYFDAIKRGEKTFDVRRDDRGFQKGDTVRLQRLCDSGPYKHREIEQYYSRKPVHEIIGTISYILTGGQFGIEPGFVVLALKIH